jgi:hypothetical protein
MIADTVAGGNCLFENSGIVGDAFADAKKGGPGIAGRQLLQNKRRSNRMRAIIEREIDGRCFPGWHFPDEPGRR